MRARFSPALQLCCASFAVLFQELALIRWLPVQVRVLAFFPNLILLGAFLGLGAGCLRAGRRPLLWTWPVAILTTSVAARLLHGVAFTQESPSEHLWLLYGDLGKDAPVVKEIRIPLMLFFALTAATFLGLGQAIADRLNAFTARGLSLSGYTLDLLGSLIGTCAFALMSFLWTPPAVWFGIVLLAALPVLVNRPRALVAYALFSCALLATVGLKDATRFYSPYYAIQTRHLPPELDASGMGVVANGSVHQYALRVGDGLGGSAELEKVRSSYRIPYRLLGRPPRHVLVLGAGTGNDVTVALDMGAQTVDAVEIEPAILQLGREFPYGPYASPRVRVHLMDARAFLAQNHDKYDMIVFGTLDSMTRLSALASVRLDNFVYTAEALQATREHLTSDGGVALYFMVSEPHIHKHILAVLWAAFGEPPTESIGQYGGLFNSIYMEGPALGDHNPAHAEELVEALNNVETPTDDWPYLYLKDRGISGFYLSVIALILAVSVAVVFGVSPELRQNLRAGGDVEMFLLGLAFLCLETKSVTAMALAWGVSWLTSAVVFASILAMALIGTRLRIRISIPDQIVLPFLAVSLFVGWGLPNSELAALAVPLRLFCSLLLVGTPILCGSLLFASAFTSRSNAATAFGWNLLGAVVGGLLELSSMAVGLRALNLIALVAYLGVFLLRRRAGAANAPPQSAALS